MKENLLISFSGGETSGYMLYYLTNVFKSRDKYNMAVVFANTGEENEETLKFVRDCAIKFKVDVIWVEANVNMESGKGTTHKIVNYKTASRKGEPFEDVIKKYGIPNQVFPHCNREMKLKPIHSYIKNELGWDNSYKTAIGIRYDEIDRMVSDRSTYNIIYPLIENVRMTKQKINFWWSKQDFRLKLKGYQGNCKTCWKKSKKNLYTIANENPEFFNFYKKMEEKYSFYTPDSRTPPLDDKGNLKPTYFFRSNQSVDDVFKNAKTFKTKIRDSHSDINFQKNIFDDLDNSESCDIFSNCGDL